MTSSACKGTCRYLSPKRSLIFDSRCDNNSGSTAASRPGSRSRWACLRSVPARHVSATLVPVRRSVSIRMSENRPARVASDHGLVEVRERYAGERGRVDREKVPKRLIGEAGHGVVLDGVPGAEEERTVFSQHAALRGTPADGHCEHHAELRGYAVRRRRRRAAGSPRRSRASRPKCPALSQPKSIDHGGIEIGCEDARACCRRPAGGRRVNRPVPAANSRMDFSAKGCRCDRRSGRRVRKTSDRGSGHRSFPGSDRECDGG